MRDPRPAIVLFDGVCNLCQASVQFIIRHDPAARFQFASLQSGVAAELLAGRGRTPDLDSVLLVEDGQVYSHSDAALRIARRLAWPWSWLYAFSVVPRPLRDAVYRLIARHRYRWFGRHDECWLPTPALRSRFLS